ncbi:type I-E CRISPR-associated protein Cas7/Cse4/CasC [Streptomyces virginiae]|uniref:Type I-E CRISPR-associated protein Cas7/Cse4/CasC n=1 Tax=Streptomyces virginiae TaxID=1961 RepID=A0ABQ3NNZ1_STRVG|nr:MULTISPECIES: type I-E CRISPR-associated protein Cas7/Cse4/CasC [Streptomyces]GLV93024.1 type I-E CRISPR-associated protein Cas7/Cse4/CasC [Streptomyces lavendulae subsp. lavendulae]KOU26462.1 CRISPR-associated protein CasC [Streptomyces sp. WM6349]KOV37202.1 CRISPR-associated protein CasC [Streptomyces sp. H036]MBP2341658.1 CRISPR system Cascade subunit CasC [Streptomyces virginiae]MCI4079362.1 type I-E CRISPR-associated protein Cas7/Cse4/CasC [Streptomyces sp. MMS21 TC-5]
MSRTILDVHILQTVPPSNINRDDTGAPKSAVYGGVRRSRVSSQAWKKATRKAFEDLLDPAELGVRTKKVVEALTARIREREESLSAEVVWPMAAEIIHAATGAKIEAPARGSATKGNGKDGADDPAAEPQAPQSSYLLFLSARQLDGLAKLAIKGLAKKADPKVFVKESGLKAQAKQIASTRHSVDIALFGRMVADTTDINVDAAAQVAHALSVHPVDLETDYFTAVDDQNSDAETGAGMIGTVDFNSATLYRYAAVDIDLLTQNLDAGLTDGEDSGTPVRRAVEAFVEGFALSMPTGKLNTFGNNTLPDAVIVKLRSARPISFVGAFENPVAQDTADGHVRAACQALAEHIPAVETAFGAPADHTWIVRVGKQTQDLAGLGNDVNLRELVTQVGQAVQARLEKRG